MIEHEGVKGVYQILPFEAGSHGNPGYPMVSVDHGGDGVMLVVITWEHKAWVSRRQI